MFAGGPVRASGLRWPQDDVDPLVIAEDAQAYLPARSSTAHLDAGDVVLRHFPHSPHYWCGSATWHRFSEATVARRIAEIRTWFREQGRREFMWMVGESATPSGLADRLLASGARWDEAPDGKATIWLREHGAGAGFRPRGSREVGGCWVGLRQAARPYGKPPSEPWSGVRSLRVGFPRHRRL
jgi:hypothetical protein